MIDSALTLTPEHGYVVFALLGILIHCFMQGIAVSRVRYSVFTEDYIKQHLSKESEELKKSIGEELQKGCHPDNGLGRFSDHLSTVDWVKLQNAQRAHLNYLETLSATLVSLALAGIFFPLYASILGVVHIVGRQLYCSGFRTRAGSRGTGFGIAMLTIIAFMGLASFGAARLIFKF